jgi:hypothetical protein
MRTDSAVYEVEFNRGLYMATVGFTYRNRSSVVLSRVGCRGPRSPDLEKKVGDRWVLAYNQIYLLCKDVPDFALRPGESSHSEFLLGVFATGPHRGPLLMVDSIEGVFRLRSEFTGGHDATAKDAAKRQLFSNEFHLVLSQRASASNTR